MRYFYTLLLLALLIIIQSTFLPVLLPWLPLNPMLLFLIVLSGRLDRNRLLAAGLWAGLVQDVLFGEVLGLFMIANFIALAIIWEIKDSLMENPVLTSGFRLITATLVQQILMAFIYYIRGLETGNLFFVLQLNAGINLLSNLLLFLLLLAWLRLTGSNRIMDVLEAKR